MPKTIKQDTGMLEREALSYEPHELAEIVDKIINTDFSFDVIWEENRKVCLSILEHAGVRSQVEPSWNPGFLDKRFDEKSSVYIATMFLQNHSRLHKYLHQFTTGSLKTVDLIHLIHHAEEMGKFQERMRWRCGIDPLTK